MAQAIVFFGETGIAPGLIGMSLSRPDGANEPSADGERRFNARTMVV